MRRSAVLWMKFVACLNYVYIRKGKSSRGGRGLKVKSQMKSFWEDGSRFFSNTNFNLERPGYTTPGVTFEGMLQGYTLEYTLVLL